MLDSIRAATAAAVQRKRMGARESMGGGGSHAGNMCEGKVGRVRHCCVCVCKLKVSNKRRICQILPSSQKQKEQD